MTPVEEAQAEGYSTEEINAHLAGQAQAARDEGYSPDEIQRFMKDNVLMTPQFNQTPLQQAGTVAVRGVKSPTTLEDAIKTGWNWSSINLGREALKGAEGKLPDMQVTGDTPWYLRGAANLTGVAADLPAMITGAVIGGGAASPVTALGGAFALPMALRKVFVDAIESGQVATKKEFAERATGTMWELAKGWITGAATAGVGKLATGATSMLPPLAAKALPTAAELATLTEVSARLEGHAPDPQALLDNAVVLGVAKAALPSWSGAKPLTETYVKTGIPPEKVTYDAVQGDKGVWQDILDGRVPEAYKTHAEMDPVVPTQAQQTKVFHGTTKVFDTVDPTKSGGLLGEGAYFTSDPSYANSFAEGSPGNVHVVDLAFKKPLTYQDKADPALKTAMKNLITPDREDYAGLQKQIELSTTNGSLHQVLINAVGTHEANHKLAELGYDGIVNKIAGTDRTDYVAFDTSAIKPTFVEASKRKEQEGATGKPPMTPEQQEQAKAFLSQPFAEIPQMPNEPARPTHINYNYIDTAESTKQALSRISELYEGKINEQRQSPRTWEQSHQDAAKVLADLLQSDPKTVSKFLAGESASPSTTAQLLARKELTLGFTEELMRSRAALEAKGDAATPEELATFLAQAERVSTVQAGFLGQRADTARALNALKSTKREADRSQAILEMLETYGGPEQVGKLVKMLGEYDNPAQAVNFAKRLTKASNWDMVVEAWKAGLVSGLRTHEVNFLSTAAFTTLRLPIESLNAVYGALQRSEDRVMFSEIPARMIGMVAGIRDGVKIAGSILRTGENILGPKTESFSPKIPGVTGEVVRVPFRVLSATDALLKSVNERSEIYALATRQVLAEQVDKVKAPTRTEEFKQWFQGSKVAEKSGDPLVVYHGSPKNFTEFTPESRGENTGAPSAESGFFFTNRKATAEYYSRGKWPNAEHARAKGEDPGVMASYIALKNPLVHDFKGKFYRDETYRALMDRAKAEGRDGVIFKNTYDGGEYNKFDAVMRGRFKGEDIYVVFEPTQIKSVDRTQTGRGFKYTFGSQPFFNRVYDLATNPTPEMVAAGQEAALRYTFNRPLGPGGQAFSRMVRQNHLEWLFPFITTPGNIFKETFRMTPGLNLAVKEWREDYKAGGARQDRAMSEVMTGGALMTAVMMAAFEGTITGGGQPDKRMRATDRAAGWKPYAVKINGRYIDGYLRMAPIGPLMGLAADSAEFLEYMTGDERDQWVRMLGFAFAQNVTNQTFATGATSLVNVLQDPSRYGENYLESLSSSLIPAIIGQTAAERDPLLREIHGMAEAMKARIPGQREGLMPTKDLFGQPIASPERLWWGSPFSVSAASIDKVRTEASRLGFATPEIPKTVDVVPGKDFKKLDKVRLTPEQKDVFATESGQFAHEILTQQVNTPEWDKLPKIVQRQIFEKTFKKSRDLAHKKLLGELDPSGRTQAVDAIERAIAGE